MLTLNELLERDPTIKRDPVGYFCNACRNVLQDILTRSAEIRRSSGDDLALAHVDTVCRMGIKAADEGNLRTAVHTIRTLHLMDIFPEDQHQRIEEELELIGEVVRGYCPKVTPLTSEGVVALGLLSRGAFDAIQKLMKTHPDDTEFTDLCKRALAELQSGTIATAVTVIEGAIEREFIEYRIGMAARWELLNAKILYLR